MHDSQIKNRPRRSRGASGSLAYYSLFAGMHFKRPAQTLGMVSASMTTAECAEGKTRKPLAPGK